jgi:hypothetical protein
MQLYGLFPHLLSDIDYMVFIRSKFSRSFRKGKKYSIIFSSKSFFASPYPNPPARYFSANDFFSGSVANNENILYTVSFSGSFGA